MSNENLKEDLVSVLKEISGSLSEMNKSLSEIKNDGLILNSQATQAFTDAVQNGGLSDILGAFTGGASSTMDVKDVLDSLREGVSTPGENQSAQSLIDSLNSAKERLSALSSAIDSNNT